MPGINDAIKQIDNLEPREQVIYTRVAKNHGVNRTTLSHHAQGVQMDRNTKNSNQAKLMPPQEHELVQYIIGLTERRLPPTREMIKNFVLGIAKVDVSESWVTRYVLTSCLTSLMASN
ncbi:hypothetical protein BU25DRAFT_420967 [Macroventuria anomochaeta]|uniref:Uncharacterized protein n=1 Tax=Macroventuria anomochaeta TaxID=301207 RepID=A0ACB6S391_9PLEO|nr:uncharacterized protein BU25DRAFT_420967 [Macroventuria anomochaeta]KAF2628503.1 hypothetical protein BU25DRAFT_420967 [Macroventuria anomochaeta]